MYTVTSNPNHYCLGICVIVMGSNWGFRLKCNWEYHISNQLLQHCWWLSEIASIDVTL